MHWGLSESLDLYEEYVRALKGLPPVDYAALKALEKRLEESRVKQYGEKARNLPEDNANAINEDQSAGEVADSQEIPAKAVAKVVADGGGDGDRLHDTEPIDEDEELAKRMAGISLESTDGEGPIKDNTDDSSLPEDQQKDSLKAEDETAPRQKAGRDLDPPETEESSHASVEKDPQPEVFYEEAPPSDIPLPRKVNILLFGAGDCRHIIHTMAKLYKHNDELKASGDPSNIELNFFVLDGCIEIVARNMALLALALEQPDFLPLRTKTHMFMDIFGNSLLRPSSHQYLAGKAKTLRNMITDEIIRETFAPFLDINSLKYTERDGLENAFNFLLPKEGFYFNIQQYWSGRNRVLLGTRYDYREGAFDWDLSMTLKDRGAGQICSQEYRHWRESGVAFTYPEYEQCKPNKTLVAALVRNGDIYVHRGYVGDLQTGPFCAFGIKCPDTRMTNSIHGDNDYRATDVTERNLRELFYELENRKPYEHDIETSRRYGSAKLLIGKPLIWNECDLNAMKNYDQPWLRIEGVNIKYLPLNEVFNLQSDIKQEWQDFFDIIFVGHNYFSFLKPSFANIMKQNSLLILETKLWSVGRKDVVSQFEKDIKEFARKCELKPALNYNSINFKYSSMKFKKVCTPKS